MMTRPTIALGLVSLATFLGCGGPDAKAPNPTRPLDERRAIEIIIRGFRDEGDHPVPGRKVDIAEGKQLEIDVASEGRKFGVAYVTDNERLALGDVIPKPSNDDQLHLVRGLEDESESRILVLHDVAYRYDDQVGTTHDQTTISAELKLNRDVRDFVVRAHAEKWP